MKKIIILIIGLFLIFICALIGVFIFSKNNIVETNTNITNVQQTTALNQEVLNTIETNETSLKYFNSYTFNEWESMIKNFYKSYNMSEITKINLKYDELNKFTAEVLGKDEILGYFVFDEATGYAKDSRTHITVDFVNNKVITEIKNKDELFTDSTLLAIGYVTNKTESKFSQKYFEDSSIYESTTIYDYRDESTRQNKNFNKLVVIPKDYTVSIAILDCTIDENGEIKPNNPLSKLISEPFVMIFDIPESTIPTMCLKIESKGFEDYIPISFSGDDGHLVLTGHNKEVKDISIY